MRPKTKLKVTWFNKTDNTQRLYLDTPTYCLAHVKPHDCEVVELDMDREFPELNVKIHQNGNVFLESSPFTYARDCK